MYINQSNEQTSKKPITEDWPHKSILFLEEGEFPVSYWSFFESFLVGFSQ